MAENYDSAATRHFEDAQRLAAEDCWDNAGHLIGFAAECALKHAFEIEEPEDNSPRVHLPDLAGALRRKMKGRTAVQVALWPMLTQNRSGYFSDWSVSGRYHETGSVTKEQYEKWLKLATRTLGAAGIRK